MVGISRADVTAAEIAAKKAEVLDEFCKDDPDATAAMFEKVKNWCSKPPNDVTKAFCDEVAKFGESSERQLAIRLGVLCFW